MLSFGDFKYHSSLINNAASDGPVSGETSRGEEIVVKLFSNEQNSQHSFETEAEVLLKLKGKKNICPCVGIKVAPSVSAIALQKYDTDLFYYAVEQKELSEKEAIKVFKEICKGVAQMHKSAIAHLDLKPENILVNTPTTSIAICDFGLSYVAPQKKISKKERKSIQVRNLGVRGSGHYVAPEVLNKENLYNPFAADIYSLGCVLLVLMTQRFPLISETGRFVLPPGVCVSASCEQLLHQMLTPHPQERPTIEELLAHPFLSHSPLSKLVKNLTRL
uniref:Protein kinase domain-containing protein n=1 Tax=Vannella robusta TaxID=1487602 RepID=A0A7S4INJ1_9EUKA|mmetsp:Transcript_5721/g.7058  ORF Transcript_5721/g.7058 Transcript_5721/m.7058 type:complete len:276 (+) Transcript_5721:57-884(+)